MSKISESAIKIPHYRVNEEMKEEYRMRFINSCEIDRIKVILNGQSTRRILKFEDGHIQCAKKKLREVIKNIQYYINYGANS